MSCTEKTAFTYPLLVFHPEYVSVNNSNQWKGPVISEQLQPNMEFPRFYSNSSVKPFDVLNSYCTCRKQQ